MVFFRKGVPMAVVARYRKFGFITVSRILSGSIMLTLVAQAVAIPQGGAAVPPKA